MLNKKLVESVILRAMTTGADFVELFAERTRNSTISLANSKVEAIKDNITCEVNVEHRATSITASIFVGKR